MVEHTFGFESHGLEEAIEQTKRALRGIAHKVMVVEQANGTFLTITCRDTHALAEASLIVGSVMGGCLRNQAFYPVSHEVTFVEKTLVPTLPVLPVNLPHANPTPT